MAPAEALAAAHPTDLWTSYRSLLHWRR